jgi:glycosyltransferase involved in cell wall biosynthesis
MTVAIAAGGWYARTQKGNFVSPTNWVSFAQWVNLFKDVRLIVPLTHANTPIDSWLRIPDNIQVCGLDVVGKGHMERHRKVRQAATEYLQGVEFLYARMPAYEVYWVFEVAAGLGIPMLVELHGDWESAARHADAGRNIIRRLARPLRAHLARRATFKMTAYASAVVTIGPVLADKYVPKNKPCLVSTNHTVKEAEYNSRKTYALNPVPRLLFVGDLQERKGVRFLFAALGQLKKMDRNFEMVMIGSGPQEENLRRYAREHDFEQNVQFTGQISSREILLQHYRQADIFILPSVAGEGVPRVIHEAQSQGCPVIATDIGSTRWQLEDNCGIVIPPGIADVLAYKIIQVLDDGGVRSRLSINGFQRSLEFTYEKQGDKIANFVNKYVPVTLLS